MYRWIMGLVDKVKNNKRAPSGALSGSDLTQQELTFILKKIRTIDFKGFELDIILSIVNKLQQQWLSRENGEGNTDTPS